MSMGWKPGEGVGVKLSRQHRQRLKRSLMQEAPKVRSLSPPRVEEMDVPSVKVYGVALPPPSFQQYSARASRLDDEDDEDERDEQLVSEPCPIDHTSEFDFSFSTPMSISLRWTMRCTFSYRSKIITASGTSHSNR